MALFMLDTNMCIYLMKNQPMQVAKRFAQCYVGDVAMSAITYAELEHGVSVSNNSTRERHNLASLIDDITVVPSDVQASKAYGLIRHATGDRKKDQRDKPIAAHAVSLKVTLVTDNERDFVSYPGPAIENWITE